MRAQLRVEGANTRLVGPLLHVRRVVRARLHDAVRVTGIDGEPRIGRVVAIGEAEMVVEVFESTAGLGLADSVVAIEATPLRFALGPGLLGRVFDSVGRPLDGGPPLPAYEWQPVDGLAVNPAARELPRDFIETGITAIDLMNSLVRGQKLPVFSGSGLPHDRLAIDIAQHARLRGEPGAAEREHGVERGLGGRGFAIVFVGIGVSHDTAEYFRSSMEASGALAHTAMFLNLARDPSTQRLLAPRYALTAAEYLAFTEGRHVLVIMTDMTNYCEALREVSSSRGEIPSRKGYPGYMYSDLASLHERAGCLRGRQGTITQLPILTMPGDDIGHPIADLTGYITEGQIVLDRELDRRGLYPPIKVLPSLSRLMDTGIGAGFTHADHAALAHQLFAAYARAVRVRLLASVMGEEGLSAAERKYLAFADAFEEQVVSHAEARTLERSMAAGWRALRLLPAEELTRLNAKQRAHYIEGGHDA
ncbi:MAG: V-type ATP synthase subunit B [Steroidobacteraceae bacterium]